MAFMEWRRFNFFEINKDVDSGKKIDSALKGAKITAASSGNGQLVFGDSEGNIHIVNRMFEVITFKAFDQKICLLQKLQHVGILVSVSEEEGGIAILKVWDCDRSDKQNLPVCVRTSRITSLTKTCNISALCVHEHQNLLAIGFTDGTIILFRGDITRERATKQTVIKDSSYPINGLAFRTTSRVSYLFVATINSIFYYNITIKDKERKMNLDSIGCEKNCSVLSEAAPETHFMIGRQDAVYCYTADGRGPCFAIEGKKSLMQWARNYLVIVAEDYKSAQDSNLANETLTVLDLQNKFLVFNTPIKGKVKAVLNEWGCFLILTEDNILLGLAEKDLQSKLSMLFKKNLYDVAIRIAKSQQHDVEGLADIYRQYGDHLYTKGDHAGAIEQYIKTIGKLEPSYVIRKFLDSQLIEHLTTYLQALHKEGLAAEDHTTLLLNCYTKLNRIDKLKEFLMTKDRELDFDVDTAIRVCRQVSIEDALILAKKHLRHEWYLRIQLEDRHQYNEVLDYVTNLEFNEAEANMKKYGTLLLQHVPVETTNFLKQLCTDYKPRDKPLVDQNSLDGNGLPLIDKASPEGFIHLFLNNSEMLIEFLEHIIKVDPKASTLIYNTLIEHYLRVWKEEKDDSNLQKTIEQKMLKLIKNPDAKYDKTQTLILCQLYRFSHGILYLYEETKMYQHILRYHSLYEEYEAMLACCKKYGTQDPSLWIQALWACAKNPATPRAVLVDVLQVIEKERLLPPLLVFDALATSSTATIGDVRNYLMDVLKTEEELAKQEKVLINKYKNETETIRDSLKNLQTKNVIFKGNLCNACNQHLELPSNHFLCMHSFHQHCFQSIADSDSECPVCLPNNKKILDIIKSQEQARSQHESFHSQLERAQDGFSLVADYFGRGLFNQLTVIPDTKTNNKETPKSKNIVSEGRLRLEEGNKSMINDNRPITDIIMRPQPTTTVTSRNTLIPSNQQSLSNRSSPQQLNRRSPQPPSAATNPFGDDQDEYDETKNPFADEDSPKNQLPQKSASFNPFEDDDDYDKNLNPFES